MLSYHDYERFRNEGDIENDKEEDNSATGSTLSCHDIRYTVKDKTDRSKKKGPKFAEKTILNGISGIFTPGMNAILGPTGSGKTSLLDVLAARKDPHGLYGTVLIDGKPQPSNFKLISGYVVQDDVVMATLTVRENLEFSAALRLPSDVSRKARAERVQDTIRELGLKACADTRIGNSFSRGVSGGERKRTNIGMELIIKPNILFLDEPTTGLDASTAKAVMQLLSRLSHRGRCIIFSIHQPRYSIYRVFDKLHLLSNGETVFHGPADQALEYFSSNGYVCEEHNNPPDFFLDLVNGEKITAVEDDSYQTEETATNNNNPSLSNRFKDSVYEHELQAHLMQIHATHRRGATTDEVKINKAHYQTSALIQFLFICARNTRNIWRNPRVSTGQVLVLAIFALLVGGIYFQLDNSATAGIQNRLGALFFIVVNMVFNNTSAVEPFISERITFLHESASGFYRVSSYFFAKVFADLIPVRFIPTTIFAVISYWMIGFRPDAISFFIFLLTLLATSFAAVSIAFVVGASVDRVGLANLYIGPCYVIMMIFGGLLVDITSLPKWLQYVQYLSIVRYSLNSLTINELSGRIFCDPPKVNGTILHCVVGNDYLASQGIDYSDWGLYQNLVALAVITMFFMFLTYVQLRRMPKHK